MLEKILIKNLMYELKKKDINNLQEAASFLNVNYNTFRGWISLNRTISLRKLDDLCDIKEIPTYYLFVNEAISHGYDDVKRYLPNNSRKVFIDNLDYIFEKRGKHTWDQRESLFYGMVSKDTLMAYRRTSKNSRYPKISTIESISSYLGIPASELFKKRRQI